MPDVQQVGQLISEGKWVLATALVVGLLVRLLKGDPAVQWFPPFLPERWRTIPPDWRAPGALALGIVAATMRLRAGGALWPQALSGGLVEGLMAGSGAIAAHAVVVDSARGGRELGESPKAFEKRLSDRPPPMPPEPSEPSEPSDDGKWPR